MSEEITGQIGVPTWLEDIETGDEISLPGGSERLVVRGTGKEPARAESGVIRTRIHLACERAEGGGQVPHVGERLDKVLRYVQLAEVKHRSQWREITDADEIADLIPALVDEVVRLRREAATRGARRVRKLAEEIAGGRGDT